MKGASYQFDNS